MPSENTPEFGRHDREINLKRAAQLEFMQIKKQAAPAIHLYSPAILSKAKDLYGFGDSYNR
jgi:hypothetical protein